MSRKEYTVLYTHQKTKKHKTWQDGILIFYKDKKKVVLHEDGTRTMLDTLFVHFDQISIGMEIESERYLITVEEEVDKHMCSTDSSHIVTSHPSTVNHDTNKKKSFAKNKEFCPPRFLSNKKTLNDGEPVDKRIKLQDKDFEETSQTTGLDVPTKNQFFSLFSHQKQNLSERKKIYKETSLRFDGLGTKELPKRTNNQNNTLNYNDHSCHSKRDNSQILALFSSSKTSKSEEKKAKSESLQVCPQLPLRISDTEDDMRGLQYYSEVDRADTSLKSKAWYGHHKSASLFDDDGFESKPKIPVNELPVRGDGLTSAERHYSNQPTVSENSLSGVNGGNLFQVPADLDYEDFQNEEPSSTFYDITGNGFDNFTWGENELSSKEDMLALSCPVTTKQKSSRHAAIAMRENKIMSLSSTKHVEQELFFPSSKDCEGNVKPCRQVIIPVIFESCIHYQQTLMAALREHINIILFNLAQNYHSALRKVDITQYSTVSQGVISDERPSCTHGVCSLKSVRKEGPNKGRLFYCCPSTIKSQCKYFKWVNEFKNSKQNNKSNPKTIRPSLCSADAIIEFFNSQGLTLHCECRLIIKRKHFYGKVGKHGGYRYSKKHLEEGVNKDNKKTVYLKLSKKQRRHMTYSKDDIWIVSTSLLFERRCTFVAKSTYFGPYSSGELEISPIGSYSPSNWHSGDIVYALHGCNAGNELTCINNIDKYVNECNMPLLDSLLYRHNDATVESTRHQKHSLSFVPPIRSTQRLLTTIPSDFAVKAAKEMIHEYKLNADQGSALLNCAHMFSDVPSHISLVHGVFGAGKSYLLAVTILYLVRLFRNINQDEGASSISQFKILVSSTTNVAVDRILLVLLDLGFDEFVRVGSVRKIAKQLLPYSMQGSGNQGEELKDLQAMLKEDLKPSERQNIRKSIEKQRLGENKKRLDRVQVVGVTCAACVFPCLENMKFCVVLLDECSQMTEPTALLPLARFGCQNLILVGDPKQLSPTIPGSTQGLQSEHHAGLEQTLFDRLTKMGYKTTLLRTQGGPYPKKLKPSYFMYRCHPTISAVANRLFYGGNLVDGVTPEQRAPIVDFAPTLCFYDVSRGQEKFGHDGSYYNDQEAKFVVFLVGCFLESGMEPEQLGVITLYKSQLATISSYLAQSRLASYKQLRAVQISTVDAFQGGEKDVILLSCVRTDHVGFIDCGRRTNVALTRAKRHLLIIGNERMLSSNEMWKNVIHQCRVQDGGIVSAHDFESSWQKDNDMDADTSVTTTVIVDTTQNEHDDVLPGDNSIHVSSSSTIDFLLESPSIDGDDDEEDDFLITDLLSIENSGDASCSSQGDDISETQSISIEDDNSSPTNKDHIVKCLSTDDVECLTRDKSTPECQSVDIIRNGTSSPGNNDC